MSYECCCCCCDHFCHYPLSSSLMTITACVCFSQYEMELQTLRQQLLATQSALDDVTSQLSREKSLSCQQYNDWQQRLRAADDRYKQHEAQLTGELRQTKHRDAELNAELSQMKQREADMTFELTQQRNRISELSLELAQTKRRESEMNDELRRLAQM